MTLLDCIDNLCTIPFSAVLYVAPTFRRVRYNILKPILHTYKYLEISNMDFVFRFVLPALYIEEGGSTLIRAPPLEPHRIAGRPNLKELNYQHGDISAAGSHCLFPLDPPRFLSENNC